MTVGFSKIFPRVISFPPKSQTLNSKTGGGFSSWNLYCAPIFGHRTPFFWKSRGTFFICDGWMRGFPAAFSQKVKGWDERNNKNTFFSDGATWPLHFAWVHILARYYIVRGNGKNALPAWVFWFVAASFEFHLCICNNWFSQCPNPGEPTKFWMS